MQKFLTPNPGSGKGSAIDESAGSILPMIGRTPQILKDTKQSLIEIFTSVNSINQNKPKKLSENTVQKI